MSKQIINTEKDFINTIVPLIDLNINEWSFEIEKKIVDLKFILPLSKSNLNLLMESGGAWKENYKYKFYFKNCEFKQNIIIRDNNDFNGKNKEYNNNEKFSCEFNNCEFNNDGIYIGSTSMDITFSESKIFPKYLNLEGSELKGKIQFRGCIFNEVNFNNTIFNDWADFRNCIFTEKTNFYNTIFFERIIFSSTIFKENVLFTYSFIEKGFFFRGVIFEKGLDLSTATFSGIISYFDVKLSYFKAYKKKLEKDQYEFLICNNGDIPIKNKRETYRVIKKNYEALNNNSESLEIKELEMRTLTDEIRNEILNTKNGWEKIPNYILLLLNKYSNNYGNSYIKGVVFTLVVGILFFYLSIIHTIKFEICLCLDTHTILEGSKYFWQFLLPTHRFDYVENAPASGWFYFFDFFGRILVGYGIYQTIQAFRKYK